MIGDEEEWRIDEWMKWMEVKGRPQIKSLQKKYKVNEKEWRWNEIGNEWMLIITSRKWWTRGMNWRMIKGMNRNE